MGFWHTGYAEFHEPTGLDNFVYSPPPPVRYVCEHCAASFAELEELRRHRFEQHPIRQPALWLRGRAVGALPQLVMTPLSAADVVVEDASRCLVNGSPVPLSKLGQRLAAMTREFVELKLENAGATTKCVLDFRIADEAHLAGVEAAFLRLARDHVLSIDALSRFIHDCREFPSAMPYCDGICHYLYGVLAKERSPDSGLKQAQYVERYLRASDELSGFDRPLARSVRALIAFHFNQFDEAELLAPEGALRHAAGAFAGLLQGMPWHFDAAFSPAPGSAVEDLLTDQDTLQILADASHGLVELKLRSDELLAHQRRAAAGGYDQLKRTLLASEALAAREDAASHTEARKLARGLASQHDTSNWAEAMLERLATP
jgi:hypothetical protein